jgi:hypothetical protein
MEALLSSCTGTIRLGVIYRSNSKKHGKPIPQFLSEFQDFIDSHATSSGNLLLVGDFNLHVDDSNDFYGNKFKDVLSELNLQQFVQESTHSVGHTLDLVITRSSELLIDNLVVGAPMKITDHRPVTFTLPWAKPLPTKKNISYRKLKNINIDDFQKDITNSTLITTPEKDITALAMQYDDVLSQILEKHALLQCKTVVIKYRPPWYTDQLHPAKVEMRRAERKWRSTKLQVHLEILQDCQSTYSQMCEKAKGDFYCDKIKENNGDQKSLFRIANTLLFRKQESMLPTHTSDALLADEFGEYFQEKIDKIRQSFKPNDYKFPVSQSAIPKLKMLEAISEDELKKMISSTNSKSCPLDPIPTTLLKSCLHILLPTICNIVNKSFEKSTVPGSMKKALVYPLLKKASLDHENRKNFRPVSNLSYLSKLVERVAVKRINEHITSHDLQEPLQSAYRQHHSVETALLKVFDDIICAMDSKQAVLLTLLDLSAAFDTVDHVILLERLETEFGICDDAKAWLNSYLSNRSQSVVINGVRSAPRLLNCGLPQGSLVGPYCFPPYSSHVGKIARKHGLNVHLYADDSQLFLAFHPEEGSTAVARMMDCIEEIRNWMEANMLKLNDSKTEFMVIATRYVEPKINTNVNHIKVGDSIVNSSCSARNIGAVMDTRLNMEKHVNSITSSCYHNLRNISKIRRNLTHEATVTLVQALVVSKLDSLNSLLYGITDTLLRKLQLVQNNAARVIVRARKHDHITPVLMNLHWLPVKLRIRYKINLLTFKCRNALAPSYLCDLIEEYKPTRSGLRSAGKDLLLEIEGRTETYGERPFSVCAPKLWNVLPQSIRSIKTLDAFKTALKTHYFRIAYNM